MFSFYCGKFDLILNLCLQNARCRKCFIFIYFRNISLFFSLRDILNNYNFTNTYESTHHPTPKTTAFPTPRFEFRRLSPRALTICHIWSIPRAHKILTTAHKRLTDLHSVGVSQSVTRESELWLIDVREQRTVAAKSPSVMHVSFRIN